MIRHLSGEQYARLIAAVDFKGSLPEPGCTAWVARGIQVLNNSDLPKALAAGKAYAVETVAGGLAHTVVTGVLAG